MNASMQLASTRLRQQYAQLDQVAQNQANNSTPGYIARDTGYRGGEFSTWLRQREGAIADTNRGLDVALPEGAYLKVESNDGIRLSRRGDLRLNEQRQLVVGQGFPILGESGNPIQVDDANPIITKDGSVISQGRLVDKIARVHLDDIRFLTGEGTLLKPDQGQNLTADTREINTGVLEASNVDAVEEQTNVVALMHRATIFSECMKTLDKVNDKAISELSRGRS
ncbi:MAG: flagellar basal body rod C-terminal domain-containing protein [Vulcanimicrobiota bacterium]